MRFAGDFPDDALAEGRLRAAYAQAGWPDIGFALEPEAAGYRFASTLKGATTVLVGDFGGGTSDFSVLRFEPGATHRVTALGHSGIGIAGDNFDYRIIDRVVSPRLGKNDNYTVMGKPLPIPPAWYTGFARWHRLSLMRAPKILRDIAEVARTADHPDRLHHLISLIEEEAGYSLYRAVSGVKAALSRAPKATCCNSGMRASRSRPRSTGPISRPGSPPTWRSSAPPWTRPWPRQACRRRASTGSS